MEAKFLIRLRRLLVIENKLSSGWINGYHVVGLWITLAGGQFVTWDWETWLEFLNLSREASGVFLKQHIMS